jgi:hypothetical protein
LHGKGKYIWADDSEFYGDIYDGDWSDSKFIGKGKYKFLNGDFYEGDFKDNKQHGIGTMRY